MILKKIDLKSLFQKLNTLVSEDMSDYDPEAHYDTRVKLPEWQLKKLKQRKQASKKRPLTFNSN